MRAGGDDDDEALRLVRAVERELVSALPGERLDHALGALRELEGQIAFRTRHDALTRLANRATFSAAASEALADPGTSPAVVVLDIDDFKLVNDTMGHAAGDLVLEAMVERVTRGLRDSDLAARVGGDEFALLIEDGDLASEVAEELLAAVREPFDVLGEVVRLDVSIGLARATPGTSASELLRRAYVAVYAAKREGRARTVTFSPHLHDLAVERRRLQADLRDALAAEEFTVWYQPIVDLQTRRAVGVEGLLRWQSAERGLVGPGDFVGEAEQCGLIAPLERWVFARAVSDLQELRRGPSLERLFLGINVSARHLMDGDVADSVLGTIATSGLEAEAIVIELTETLMLERSERVIDQLDRLRAAGVRLAFDDFGTGYSSLAYLRTFPVDLLKIAQPFVEDLLEVERDPARGFAAAITMLGGNLGLDVIAEGIEEASQARRLIDIGCRLGQGYLFGEPMPPDRLRAALAAIDLRAAETHT